MCVRPRQGDGVTTVQSGYRNRTTLILTSNGQRLYFTCMAHHSHPDRHYGTGPSSQTVAVPPCSLLASRLFLQHPLPCHYLLGSTDTFGRQASEISGPQADSLEHFRFNVAQCKRHNNNITARRNARPTASPHAVLLQ